MKRFNGVALGDFSLNRGFWKDKTELIANDTIPYQWLALNNQVPGAPPSHAVENFRIAAGESQGKPKGTIFQDSDVAKWIEAASYSLLEKPDPALEEKIDELVRLVEKSQQEDGYVNTYFIASAGLDKKWSDLVMGHELYCAGHMIEAAVAYFEVTGKRRLMDVMRRYADYIGKVFGPAEGQNHAFDGHPEIELALNRLAKATGDHRYADLANHFIDVRGTVKDFHVGREAMEGMIQKTRWFNSDYYLADKPVRQMRSVQGHAVRAMYLYTAMADYYLDTGDAKMLEALRALWKNAVSRQMYVTAGLGSQSHGERFTIDYDLPNDTSYTETCASIGLAFWAWRMLLIEPRGEYADVFERAMYNGILSGVSLDGKKYFYVNPLEVHPDVAACRQDQDHVALERVGWFDCACCPTNVARFIASIGAYALSLEENAVWLHQYISGSWELLVNGATPRLFVETDYPWNGRIEISVAVDRTTDFSLNLRIPGWCVRYSLSVNGNVVASPAVKDGYVRIPRQWADGDKIELLLEMPVRLLKAHSLVREDAGKVAVQRGPIVYCVEQYDNGRDLHGILVDVSADAKVSRDDKLPPGTVVLELPGVREGPSGAEDPLYTEYADGPSLSPCTIRAIPYHQWGNRTGKQEMLVWLRAHH